MAIDPATAWIYSFLLPKIVSVKALDASTVEFVLEQGSANLPVFLCQPAAEERTPLS